MYLTAHNLRSPEGKLGINAFLHLHGEHIPPGVSWEDPDPILIAEQYPGSLVNQSYDLPPPGNDVLSYLDIVAEDSTEKGQVSKALDEFAKNIASGNWPDKTVINRIGIRFSMQRRSIGFELEEYTALKERALELLPVQVDKSHFQVEPLTVEVTIDENGYRFILDDNSTRRLREYSQGKWKSRAISVDHATKMNFERLHGDIIPHVIVALTCLRLEQAVEFGGVCFLQKNTGKTLRKWPETSGPSGAIVLQTALQGLE